MTTKHGFDESWIKSGAFKLHILNEVNKPITKSFIEAILMKYGVTHKIKKLDIFQTAMNHVSYLNRTSLIEKTAQLLRDVPPIDQDDILTCMSLQSTEYGRLEFLGDAFIHYVLASYLYERYPNENEGFLTILRIKLEKGEALAKLSYILNLPEYAVIARNVEAMGRYKQPKLAEDLFESFIGALLHEMTREECEQFLINLIETDVDMAELLAADDNYKDMLAKYFKAQHLGSPIFADDEENGVARSRIIHPDTKKIIGTGTGETKSKARVSAAKDALITLGVILENNDADNDFYGELEPGTGDYIVVSDSD